MITIKSYTDLSQSKTLSKILPLESADMHYYYDNDFSELESIPTITEEDDHFVLFPKDVRCWSLTALLSVLPIPSLHQTKDKRWYCNAEPNRLYFSKHHNNPVDACVELIQKLNELKML